MQKAKERYEKNHPGKKWDKLSASTRDKYYYEEQKIYDEEHGERGASWNHVPANTTFKDYLKNQPEEFQRSWLGEKRFELYKEGSLKFEDLVKPDLGYKVPLHDLNQDSSNNSTSENNSTSISSNTGYNNSNHARVTPTQKPLGRTAQELKLDDPILTVDMFNERFKDTQKEHEDNLQRLEELNDQKLYEINKKNISEHDKFYERVDLLQWHEKETDILNDIRRDNIFNTIFPDLNPNSINREKLTLVPMNNERYIPLKTIQGQPQKFYDIKDNKIVDITQKSANITTLTQPDEEYNTRFVKGKDLFGRIADSMGYDITSVVEKNEVYGIRKRGFCTAELDQYRDNGKNIIALSKKQEPRQQVATVVHEYVHALENKYPELRRKVSAYYIKVMTNLDGSRGRIRNIPRMQGEKYRIPNINMLDDGEYAFKYTGNDEGTEILTQFFTEMIERPEDVIKNCPEWFNGMMECLKQ